MCPLYPVGYRGGQGCCISYSVTKEGAEWGHTTTGADAGEDGEDESWSPECSISKSPIWISR